MLTGLLHLSGVELGPSLLPPSSDNPKGFFESVNLVKINYTLLNSLYNEFRMTAPFPEGWLELPLVQSYKQLIQMAVEEDFPTTGLFALKDPRLCLVYPLWDQIFQEMDIERKVLLIIRPPLEVAQSLAVRNNFSLTQSIMLWMVHVLQAEKNTRHLNRIVFTYDDVLRNWSSVIEIIESQFKFTFPRKNIGTKAAIDEFISEELYHQRSTQIEFETPILEMVLSTANILMELLIKEKKEGRIVANKDDIEELHRIFELIRKSFLSNETIPNLF